MAIINIECNKKFSWDTKESLVKKRKNKKSDYM